MSDLLSQTVLENACNDQLSCLVKRVHELSEDEILPIISFPCKKVAGEHFFIGEKEVPIESDVLDAVLGRLLTLFTRAREKMAAIEKDKIENRCCSISDLQIQITVSWIIYNEHELCCMLVETHLRNNYNRGEHGHGMYRPNESFSKILRQKNAQNHISSTAEHMLASCEL